MYPTMCFICIFTGYFLQQFEHRKEKMDFMRITIAALSSVCGFCADFNPQIIPNRIFTIFCVYGNMVFSITVLSILMKSLSTPFYEEQIDSVQEIVNKSFKLAGDEFALQHLSEQNVVNDFVMKFKFFLFSLF